MTGILMNISASSKAYGMRSQPGRADTQKTKPEVEEIQTVATQKDYKWDLKNYRSTQAILVAAINTYIQAARICIPWKHELFLAP